MEDKDLFPNGWAGSNDKAYLERVNAMMDLEGTGWVDKDGKPESCYCCPFVIWYRDYKRCSVLGKQLHPCFRINARLKTCPIKISGMKG